MNEIGDDFFFRLQHPHNDTPTLLWLQGGPGGTSLFGLFAENGPYVVTRDMKLKERVTSWALTHNVIYIDNPVGTGNYMFFTLYFLKSWATGKEKMSGLALYNRYGPQLNSATHKQGFFLDTSTNGSQSWLPFLSLEGALRHLSIVMIYSIQ